MYIETVEQAGEMESMSIWTSGHVIIIKIANKNVLPEKKREGVHKKMLHSVMATHTYYTTQGFLMVSHSAKILSVM